MNGQVDTTALAAKVSNKAAKVLTKAEVDSLPMDKRVYHYLESQKSEISRALPSHLNPERMARIALTLFRTTPKLLDCTIESLMGAVMQAAQLGLEPGLIGHCYIIPYGREAQFQIGYKGMIDLARRSGHIQSITVHEVYINDSFKLTYGLDDSLEHIPWHLREDTHFDAAGPNEDDIKNLRGVYAVARFKDGGYQLHYMPIAEIEKHKLRSKTWRNGPWQTDYIEMAKKTVIRAMWKLLPISVEIAQAVAASDGTVKTTIDADMTQVEPIDVDWRVVEEAGDSGEGA